MCCNKGGCKRYPPSPCAYDYKRDVILDRGLIDDLHKILGNKVGYRFFIIAPAASVMFFEDYIAKGKTKYFALRIPYSIIDELHRKGFSHIKQPVSEFDLNNTVDVVGSILFKFLMWDVTIL